MLSIIFVCEWSYQTWGELVQKHTVRDDFVTYEWVDLPSGPQFKQVVAYLRGLLDKEGKLIDEAERERCNLQFVQAVQLEEDFFEYAYKT